MADASQPRREPPTQNQVSALDPCQSPTNLQQDGVALPQGAGTVNKGKNKGETDILNPNVAIQSSQLTPQQQNMALSIADDDVGRGVSADIPGYDHSWVEHYPLPPRIRTRTQSQDGLFTKGRYAECKGCLTPATYMQRVSSLPSFLDADGVRDERYVRPAMGLFRSRKQTGGLSREANEAYPGNLQQFDAKYENADLQTAAIQPVAEVEVSISPAQCRAPANDIEVHGQAQSTSITIPEVMAAEESQTTKAKHKRKEYERLSGRTSGINLRKTVAGDVGAVAWRKSLADIVAKEVEDEGKKTDSSDTGTVTRRFGQSSEIATEAHSALTTAGTLPPNSNGNGSYTPERLQESGDEQVTDHQKKEATLIRGAHDRKTDDNGTSRDVGVDLIDKATVRCHTTATHSKARESIVPQASTHDTATNTSEVLADPATPTEFLTTTQPSPCQSVDSLVEAPQPSNKALPRWVPQRTVVPMIPESCKKNWLERLGQASEFKAVVSLETPGFDLSAMSFAERVRTPKTREPLPSAWMVSSAEGLLGITATDSMAMLSAIPIISPMKQSPSHNVEVGSLAVQRSQHLSGGDVDVNKQGDMRAKPATPSNTDAEMAREINSPLRWDKARKRTDKQVVQMPRRRSSNDNDKTGRQDASMTIAQNIGIENTTRDADKRDKFKTAVAIPRIDFTQSSFNGTVKAKHVVPKALQETEAAVPQIRVPQDLKHEIEKTKDEEERQRRSRAATMISQPITQGCTLRSERVTAIDVGATSTLKTYQLNVKTPEWSDLSSSISSLATFITAPESPIRSWSPNQERWSNQSLTTPHFASPEFSAEEFSAASTSSDATDNIVPLSKPDASIVTTPLADSPASVFTEKAGEGEYLRAKARVGNIELSAEFLLHLVSELSPESYRDIYQKYPTEFESLLRLWQTTQSSAINTVSSSRTFIPQAPLSADSSSIETTPDASEGYLVDDSGHEVALAEARRGKKAVLYQKISSSHQKQKGIDQEQAQLFENWLEPSSQITQNSGEPKSETGELRQEVEIFGGPQDGYVGQFGETESSTYGHKFTTHSPERGKVREPGDNDNAIINDPAIIAQGRIVSGSGGRGKPTKRAQRKKYNRFVAAERPPRHTPAPNLRGSISEPTVFNKQLVSDIGHVGLAARICYAAQASPVLSSASPPTYHYSTPVYFSPLAIQNKIIANPTTLPSWPDHRPTTIWMDYYGKLHSHKLAYPKCKWVGSEMIILPNRERVLPPGRTNQVVSTSARQKRAQHSFPQTDAYRMSMDYLRSSERSPSGGDHVHGWGLVPLVPQIPLSLAGDAQGRYERAQRFLPTLWTGQDLAPEQLFEQQNRTAAREESLRTGTTESQGGNPDVGKFGAKAQEADSLENKQRTPSSEEGVKINPLEASLNQWNAQFGKPEAIKSAPHTPVEIITGFLPCRKCEVTSAIEDFVVKCPKCEPDYQHESNPWS